MLTSGGRRPKRAEMLKCYSCQTVFEDSVQLRLVVVLRSGLLHFQPGFAAPDLQTRDVVVEPGCFVHEVPADVRLLHTGQAGEYFADAPAALRPPKTHDEAFGEAKRVPQGGARRLVDGGFDAVAEVHLRQVAVVHVS